MGKFKKGESGNPKGRPEGSGYADKLREAIKDDMPEIIQSLVSAAISGDTSAAKILLDRVIPAIKPIQQTATVSTLKGKALSEQGAVIVEAMASGELSPEQAQAMLSGLASLARIKEVDELERRLAKLEEANN